MNAGEAVTSGEINFQNAKAMPKDNVEVHSEGRQKVTKNTMNALKK